MFKYHHVLDIAKNLQITPLLHNLQRRIDSMIKSPWKIQSDDIDKVYNQAKLNKDHPLRQNIVNALAPAWGKLYGKNKDRLYKLAWDVPEFWADIEARWAEMEKESEEVEKKN